VHNTQRPHPRATPQEETDTTMATILDIRRTELAHTIERLREQRAQIDEKLRKLEQELESLKEFVPATDGE
jgi:chromosome segregation ATPase